LRKKLRSADLGRRERGGIVLIGSVQLALLATALRDLRRRPAGEIRGDKRLWVALSFVNFAGPIAYFLIGRRRLG
jgi:hypothetical protein